MTYAFAKRLKVLFLLLGLLSTAACSGQSQDTQPKDELLTESNILLGYDAIPATGQINLVIEIPAGTQQKWEAMKSGEGLVWDRKNGELRVISYLPYPGNYGMIPRTLLPKSAGGDGDPLDVILLGSGLERGTVVQVHPIGVLRLLDGGEQDDKIIAVPLTGPLSHISDIEQLDANYKGATDIIEIWFSNYKGPGKMESLGYADAKAAWDMITLASEAFEAKVMDSK